MGRLIQAVCVAMLCAIAAPLSADDFDDVRAWLERMTKAMQGTDYQGTFVYLRGDDVETIQLTHLEQEGVVRERLVAVSGPPREILRDDAGVRAIFGDEGDPLQDPLFTGAVFPEFSLAALEQARGRYLFEVGGTGRVAGHLGRKITIVPKDAFRYGYELWLEEQTALLLRWVLYDGERRTLAKLIFTDLVTGEAVDPAGLESKLPAQRFVTISASAPKLQPSVSPTRVPVTPRDLPAGFRLAMAARSGEDSGYEHLVFSDGLASVSVYLESASRAAGLPQGLSRMGTTNAWSRASGAWRVTAVGEVPPVTLRTIGEAFLRDVQKSSGPG